MPRTPMAPRRPRIEVLEDRIVMAVKWAYNDVPPGFKASVENASLKMVGSGDRDYVEIQDYRTKYTDPEVRIHGLKADERYFEIQHRDGRNYLRRGWVLQNEVNNSFIFVGNAGNDFFKYVDTSRDTQPLKDLRVIAMGGPGDDMLYGHRLNDLLFGDGDNDTLIGGLGNDLINGGAGDDRLWGDAVTTVNTSQTTDADYLIGGPGLDKIYANQGGDILIGGDPYKIADGVVDWLYGYSEADCFYTEFDSEARDFSTLQNDKRLGLNDPAKPPSEADWLARHHPAIDPLGDKIRLLADPKFRAEFPRLTATNFDVLGPATDQYNCFAAAMGIFNEFVLKDPTGKLTSYPWQTVDKEFQARYKWQVSDYTAAAAQRTYANKEMVVLYGFRDAKNNVQITHAARRLPDGSWLSKLGKNVLIRHTTLDAIAGGIYGTPQKIYLRDRIPCPC